MKTFAVLLVLGCLGQSAVALAADCAAFRCRYGDVPRPPEPLIAEPFHVFYDQPTTRPMRPYRALGAEEMSKDSASEHSNPGGEEVTSPRREAAAPSSDSVP
ncbi:hypothetical protein [Salinicola tamaricis]|uniref:hypothetical protein n=1 Tax=Salinicola tamaricis TaxID=1771309 RepID=UPI000D09C0C8|nr:hypothetical protein [Salinicola tamaricis]